MRPLVSIDKQTNLHSFISASRKESSRQPTIERKSLYELNVSSHQAEMSRKQEIRSRERFLYEEQINQVKMINHGREVGVDCGYSSRYFADEIYVQLNATKNCVSNQENKPCKKSFMKKIRNFLANNNNQDSKIALNARGEIDWSRQDATVHNQMHSKHQKRWIQTATNSSANATSAHKSRTLSSKSTQNLLNNSMRFLSSSRKSMNLSSMREPPDEGGTKFFSSRSFMSGFLTLGRRNGSNTAAAMTYGHKGDNSPFKDKKEYAGLGSLFTDNQQSRQSARRNLRYDSVDSLPSADSGLSCSNIQNLSSSDENQYSSPHLEILRSSQQDGNIYSKVPIRRKVDRIGCENIVIDCKEREVLGKAVARVDCNPCAYDKEALVYKKGDTIDILERNQSGTWVGRCGHQVGHFKFINVLELEEDRSSIDQLELETESSKPVTKLNFVTKLEIKSPVSANDSNRNSLVLTDTLNDERIEDSNRPLGAKENKLIGNETLMGSLEQLLTAIGLGDCRGSRLIEQPLCGFREQEVDGQNDDDRSFSSSSPKISENQVINTRDLSYLKLLNENGINSFETFSSIERFSDLERIGIIDDEHQQRLLMAARIIRQALQAAKVNFVENYCSNTSGLELSISSEMAGARIAEEDANHDEEMKRKGHCELVAKVTRKGSTDLPPPVVTPVGMDLDSRQHQERSRKQTTAKSSLSKREENSFKPAQREPIYANLKATQVDRQQEARDRAMKVGLITGKGTQSMLNAEYNRVNLNMLGSDFQFNELTAEEAKPKLRNNRLGYPNDLQLAKSQAEQQLDHHYHVLQDKPRKKPLPPARQLTTMARCDRMDIPSTTRLVSSGADDWLGRGNSSSLAKKFSQQDLEPLRDAIGCKQNAPKAVPFARSCSIRVSTRKPKLIINSRLIGRAPCDPRRSSQHNHSSSRSVPPATITRCEPSSSTPSHGCSCRTYYQEDTLGYQNDAIMASMNRLDIDGSHYGVLTNVETIRRRHDHDNRHGLDSSQRNTHYRMPDSTSHEIISSKSAYDLNVNISKFFDA